jgi:hypothetical protein
MTTVVWSELVVFGLESKQTKKVVTCDLLFAVRSGKQENRVAFDFER